MTVSNRVTEAEQNRVRSLAAQGMTQRQIAQAVGRSGSTVSDILRKFQEPAAKPSGRLPVAEFAESAMQVDPEWKDDEQDLGELWGIAERRAARDIEKSRKRDSFSATFTTTVPIAIAFVSDQHIGPGTPCDFRRLREDAELIRDTPGLFAALGGDSIDNHIKHSSAIMASRSTPSDQYLLFNYYLQIFRDKIVTLISGNHDNWTTQLAGVDMIQWLAGQNKICYSPDQAFIKAKVGDIDYGIAIRHQYRMNSSLNQTHSPKQWLRNFPFDTLPDIVGVCHHHDHAIEQAVLFGRPRWFFRPGSYQVTSAYSRQYGYNLTSPTCPTFVLYPDRHEVVGFGDIRQAVGFLKYIRGN